MVDPNQPPDEGTGKPAPEHVTSERIKVRMPDVVPDWGDPVCSCEAEPYWLAVAEELEQAAEEEKEFTPPPDASDQRSRK